LHRKENNKSYEALLFDEFAVATTFWDLREVVLALAAYHYQVGSVLAEAASLVLAIIVVRHLESPIAPFTVEILRQDTFDEIELGFLVFGSVAITSLGLLLLLL